MVVQESGSTQSGSSNWPLLGSKLPKLEIVFFTQVILLYIVIGVSLVNLSIGRTEELWILLLCSCLGYILPNPSLKSRKQAV
jgi:hypothetical protein